MRWVRCHHAAEFVAKAADFLERNEAENNLMLGLALAITADPDYTALPPFMSVAQHGRTTAAAVFQAPPRPLIVTRLARGDLSVLVQHLRKEKVKLSGLVGPIETAAALAELWTEATGAPYVVEMRQRIYQLTKVLAKPEAPGRLRPAEPREIDYLIEWFIDFDRAAGTVTPPSNWCASTSAAARCSSGKTASPCRWPPSPDRRRTACG